MHTGARAGEGGGVPLDAAGVEEGWKLRTARLGRELRGDGRLGGTFGLASEIAGADPAGTQDHFPVSRKRRDRGSDVRAAGGGAGEDGAGLGDQRPAISDQL